jgi:hypothetical protein
MPPARIKAPTPAAEAPARIAVLERSAVDSCVALGVPVGQREVLAGCPDRLPEPRPVQRQALGDCGLGPVEDPFHRLRRHQVPPLLNV